MAGAIATTIVQPVISGALGESALQIVLESGIAEVTVSMLKVSPMMIMK